MFGFNSALITKFPPREERTSSHDDFTLPRSPAPALKIKSPLWIFQGEIRDALRENWGAKSRPNPLLDAYSTPSYFWQAKMILRC